MRTSSRSWGLPYGLRNNAVASLDLSGPIPAIAWLPGLVGSARAREMIFTGDRIDAAKALDWGLANQVVGPDALAAQLEVDKLKLKRV